MKMCEISNVTPQKHNSITIKIYSENSKYDHIIITRSGLFKVPLKIKEINSKTIKDFVCGDCTIKLKPNRIIYLDGILAHYLIQELRISSSYRNLFISKVQTIPNGNNNRIFFKLVPAKKEIIDYAWNYRTIHLAWERVELDHALSWFSTLGGAFSALGDYFTNCALMAGKISFHQLKLAVRLGDPTVAARCKLYFSLSLIQRGYFRFAQKIIQTEYASAKQAIVVDTRLIKMCFGIWAKLKYEYSRKRRCIQ